MRRMVVLSLLLFVIQCSTAVSQRPFEPKQVVDALRKQDTYRVGVIPDARRAAGQSVVEHSSAELMVLESEAKLLSVQLADFMVYLHRTGDEPSAVERLEVLVARVQQNLHRNAEARIPRNATDDQRRKLRAAAEIDIRRTRTEFRSRIATEQAAFSNQLARAGGLDIFGPESLFAKVMRHQGLK